jgi:hypothetical protein
MLISVKVTPEVRQHAARMYMHRLALLKPYYYCCFILGRQEQVYHPSHANRAAELIIGGVD